MRFDPRLDAYRELGVSQAASAEAIRKAYLALVRRFHPDRAPAGKQAEYEERMKRINTAYDILSDPDKRRLYDRTRNGNGTPPTVLVPKGNPSNQSVSSYTRDPYPQMRAGYQRRLYSVQLHSHQLPRLAQLLTGLFAGLGLILGFVLGLPFGIIGCFPGALVGIVAGFLVGIGMVYLLTLAVPIVILGWLGATLLGEAGQVWGMALGAGLGIAGIGYLIRRVRRS